MNMRIIVPLILLLSVPLLLYSQTPQGQYLKVDYLNVGPDDKEQFLGEVQIRWKNEMESRVKSGEITEWLLYKVNFSAARDRVYNFVSVISADSLSAFESSDDHETAQGSKHRERGNSPVLNHAVIHSELWKVQNNVTWDETLPPSRFKVMDYMNVRLGREYEYQMFEDEVARPLHEDRMGMDRMNAWELYELIMPGGINYGYNFSTGNFFSSLGHIEFGFTDEMIRANHPDVDLMEFFQTIFSARDLVQSDLWELVDFASD